MEEAKEEIAVDSFDLRKNKQIRVSGVHVVEWEACQQLDHSVDQILQEKQKQAAAIQVRKMQSVSRQTYRDPRALGVLGLFLAVVIGVGLVIGTQSPPGDWYQDLQKPAFNPPNWMFPPVWTVLYIFIAVAGWRTFMTEPRSGAMTFWVAQMLLNWMWSPVFFTLHMIWPAFAIIILLFLAILAFIRCRWPHDRPAALLFSAYAAWVGFAVLLNGSIAFLN